MILQVSIALKNEGTRYPFEENGEFRPFQFTGEDLSFVEPVKVVGFMTGVGESIALEGTILAKLKGSCARCLEPAAFDMEIPFKEVFVRHASDDEPDAFLFEGNTVELEHMVLSNIIVNLPMQLLCGEECKGLCPMCGTNLNHSTCECDPVLERSAFSGLKQLLMHDE